MKEILLTQGKVALVDDSDFEALSKFNWCTNNPRRGRNAIYAQKALMINGKTNTVSMHRFILNIEHGDKRQVDHIDHNGLNNQRNNLRICTHLQNLCNLKKKSTINKFKGVGFHKASQKIMCKIRVNKKDIYLGLFPNTTEGEIAAAITYNDAAKKYFGEFAYLNNLTL